MKERLVSLRESTGVFRDGSGSNMFIGIAVRFVIGAATPFERKVPAAIWPSSGVRRRLLTLIIETQRSYYDNVKSTVR